MYCPHLGPGSSEAASEARRPLGLQSLPRLLRAPREHPCYFRGNVSRASVSQDNGLLLLGCSWHLSKNDTRGNTLKGTEVSIRWLLFRDES